MNIQEMLQQTNAVGAISRELGIDPATAQAGAAALMPQILSGFQEPAAPVALASTGGTAEPQAFGGLGGLLDTITNMGGGALLDNVTSKKPTQVSQGNEILGQIFGSKDRSREVAADASQQSGVEPSILKKMLPVLAMAAAGYIARNAGQGQGQGGIGGALAGMLGGDQPTAAGGAQSDILGNLIGAAGKYLGR